MARAAANTPAIQVSLGNHFPMKKNAFICLIFCVLASACVSRDLPSVGTYFDSEGGQSIHVAADTLEIKMRSRVFGEKQEGIFNLRLTYSVNKKGEIRLIGSSNSKAYLAVSTLYKWRIYQGQIVREDVSSGETTIFRKREGDHP